MYNAKTERNGLRLSDFAAVFFCYFFKPGGSDGKKMNIRLPEGHFQYYGLPGLPYRKAAPERGSFFRLQVYKRVGPGF